LCAPTTYFTWLPTIYSCHMPPMLSKHLLDRSLVHLTGTTHQILFGKESFLECKFFEKACLLPPRCVLLDSSKAWTLRSLHLKIDTRPPPTPRHVKWPFQRIWRILRNFALGYYCYPKLARLSWVDWHCVAMSWTSYTFWKVHVESLMSHNW